MQGKVDRDRKEGESRGCCSLEAGEEEKTKRRELLRDSYLSRHSPSYSLTYRLTGETFCSLAHSAQYGTEKIVGNMW